MRPTRENRENYTDKEVSKLARQMRTVQSQETGSLVCPYCKHLEARFRITSTDAGKQVRVRCSQCQLQTTFDFDRSKRRFLFFW